MRVGSGLASGVASVILGVGGMRKELFVKCCDVILGADCGGGLRCIVSTRGWGRDFTAESDKARFSFSLVPLAGGNGVFAASCSCGCLFFLLRDLDRIISGCDMGIPICQSAGCQSDLAAGCDDCAADFARSVRLTG